MKSKKKDKPKEGSFSGFSSYVEPIEQVPPPPPPPPPVQQPPKPKPKKVRQNQGVFGGFSLAPKELIPQKVKNDIGIQAQPNYKQIQTQTLATQVHDVQISTLHRDFKDLGIQSGNSSSAHQQVQCKPDFSSYYIQTFNPNKQVSVGTVNAEYSAYGLQARVLGIDSQVYAQPQRSSRLVQTLLKQHREFGINSDPKGYVNYHCQASPKNRQYSSQVNLYQPVKFCQNCRQFPAVEGVSLCENCIPNCRNCQKQHSHKHKHVVYLPTRIPTPLISPFNPLIRPASNHLKVCDHHRITSHQVQTFGRQSFNRTPPKLNFIPPIEKSFKQESQADPDHRRQFHRQRLNSSNYRHSSPPKTTAFRNSPQFNSFQRKQSSSPNSGKLRMNSSRAQEKFNNIKFVDSQPINEHVIIPGFAVKDFGQQQVLKQRNQMRFRRDKRCFSPNQK